MGALAFLPEMRSNDLVGLWIDDEGLRDSHRRLIQQATDDAEGSADGCLLHDPGRCWNRRACGGVRSTIARSISRNTLLNTSPECCWPISFTIPPRSIQCSLQQRVRPSSPSIRESG